MSGHTYTGKCHLACMHADLSKCGTRKFHLEETDSRWTAQTALEKLLPPSLTT